MNEERKTFTHRKQKKKEKEKKRAKENVVVLTLLSWYSDNGQESS
jgi:hypothetical protein